MKFDKLFSVITPRQVRKTSISLTGKQKTNWQFAYWQTIH